ncbi:MAG: NUDIX domain-containing protein [Acidobacteriota bacterium]|nr:NUDIX domain-containing protein [Acidobacteriota bacterium]
MGDEFDYPVPIVRLIIADDRGRVLILRRHAESEYGKGSWCLPGGKVDYGDTVEATVEKELREETTLECTAMEFLFYQDSLPLEPGRMHGINFYFKCIVSGEIELNDESSEYVWLGPDDLDGYDIAFRNDEALRLFWKDS